MKRLLQSIYMISVLLLPTLITARTYFIQDQSASVPDQERKVVVSKDKNTAPAEIRRRVAFVIGNADYSVGPLRNPKNDAREICKVLESLGFDVIKGENMSKKDMEEQIRNFGTKLKSSSVALFYYSGHGMQMNGRNYLIPVGSRIDKEADIEYEGVDIGRVLSEMEDAQNSVNIVILDACRDNPFTKSFRSGSGGLALMLAPTGTIIAYATSPGKTASDGEGNNGLYTQELLKAMQEPGLKIEDVFKRARQAVFEKSGKKQLPWDSTSLMGEFYFHPDKSDVKRPAQNAPAGDDEETIFWTSVEKNPSLEGYNAYLRKYTNGKYALIANIRIKEMQKMMASKHPEEAYVYVIRKFEDKSGDLPFFINNLKVADVGDSHYFLIKLPEGSYVFRSRNERAPVGLTVQVGQDYFIYFYRGEGVLTSGLTLGTIAQSIDKKGWLGMTTNGKPLPSNKIKDPRVTGNVDLSILQ